MATSPSLSPPNGATPPKNFNSAAANSLSELAQSVKEKGLWIFGESESKRRVIKIEKRDGSYGFTLQSYGVRYKHGNRETDFITYVNAVEKDGAAFHAGLREGDVILSINGQNMARVEHKSLVAFIRQCPTNLKMIVVSDERARKVELHMRYVHLQKKLQDKMRELDELNKTEKEILLGTFDGHSVDLVGTSCFNDPSSSSCCFCPTKPKTFALLDESKEKSKTMGGSTKSRNKDLYYECYRKSQSTKELHTTDSGDVTATTTTIGSIVGIQPAKKAQSGGELSTLPSSSSSSYVVGVTPGPNFNATPVVAGGNSNAGRCHHHHHHHHNNASSTHHQAKVGSTPSTSADTGGQGSSSKQWDNLMTTKSFGGYGFGFGYGYYPSKQGLSEHHHFSHPHHHNHHTHCSNHSHYYYNGGNNTSSNNKSSQQPCGGGAKMLSRRSSADSTTCHVGGEGSSSTRAFTNYTTYKMDGTTRVVARVTMGNIETSSGACTRTLPSTARSSSSSRQTPDAVSFLEKTLSDSSLNSERHKDFPKSISYFSKSSEADGHYSSDDDYEEYATEASFGPKNDIYV
ncbi:uncharacterized protein LOC110855855 isoform X1 [Folsomia candida]|uniref:uncharacterized protein LOC110855855 isoform X1 n=1 Tax=Folsomia candida TaxID=158441 RepID=UPI001604DC0D|nr:uncharacterized protein LOC110855855 isoform X1 [Folsomia candida]XP_035712721.1 uncharacterized protein LOC110855855 isoform X1 [Folsomia candida]